MSDQIIFVSADATHNTADGVVDTLLAQLGEAASGLDIIFTFISSHFTQDIPYIIEQLSVSLKPGVLLGCTAEGVIGNEREIEAGPAISLLAAHLPGVKLTPFALQRGSSDWHRTLLDADKFCHAVEIPQDTRLIVLMSDPFSTPIDDVLHSFNNWYPGIPIVGGMASGSLRPNGNALIVNKQITQEGAVGVALSGALSVDVVVSQGCRPIWRPFKVTAAHRNEIYNLEDRSPLAWIQDLIPTLSDEDRMLLQNGLFVGRAIKRGGEAGVPPPELLGRGDFLIRGLVGINQENGAIAISDSVLDGEVIQFHLRDALTAQEDLEMMLIPQMFRPPPSGGLLFACNGRGTRLYDHPNGDISIIQNNLINLNLAGFFCAGEIGPVGGQNFVHGQSISLALFRPLDIENPATSP
jgi:small ligand-binding sensory domain FIST